MVTSKLDVTWPCCSVGVSVAVCSADTRAAYCVSFLLGAIRAQSVSSAVKIVVLRSSSEFCPIPREVKYYSETMLSDLHMGLKNFFLNMTIIFD